MYVRTGLIVALLLGTMGCKKSMAAGSYEVDYDDYGSYGEAEAMDGGDFDDAPMMEESRLASRRADRASRRGRPGAIGGTSPPPSPPTPAATPEDGVDPNAATDEPEPENARHIIYTATMHVSVFNLPDAMARAESLPSKYGGFIQNMSANRFIMRIPSAQLRPVMDELAGLGVVDDRTLDAQDVTEEYLDIETRIEVLERTQKQMMELLTKASTVEEALKVRQALDEITMELEVLKGRLRRLASLVSFSTLTLSLAERGPHNVSPSSNDPFPWVDELGVEATEWK